MRIEALRIDGYGIHANLEIADLPRGLTIVTGPNETGKTTLLDFIRGVLFDFPNRAKRTLPFHEPLHGGRHGGAATLVDGLGHRWFLERHVGDKEPRLVSQDGEAVSPAMLSVLLGGANDALFRNVFAFGLGELSSFSSLNSEEVRERVFSAGVLGAGRSANQAIKQIDAQRTKLVKQRSAASPATDLQLRLGELDDNLRAARRSAEHYPALLLDQQVAEERLDDARVEEEAVRTRATELQHLATLEPIWRDRSEAAATLEAIGPILERHEKVMRLGDSVRRLVRGESGHAERVAKLLDYASAIEAAGVELESVRRRARRNPDRAEVPLAIAARVVEQLRRPAADLARRAVRGAEDALLPLRHTRRHRRAFAHPRGRGWSHRREKPAAITADLEVAQQLDTAIRRSDEARQGLIDGRRRFVSRWNSFEQVDNKARRTMQASCCSMGWRKRHSRHHRRTCPRGQPRTRARRAGPRRRGSSSPPPSVAAVALHHPGARISLSGLATSAGYERMRTPSEQARASNDRPTGRTARVAR